MSEPTREMRDRAIAVAKDVIEQIGAAESYVMTRGTYLAPACTSIHSLSGDLRDHLPRIMPGCEVCMLGAVLLSKAKLFDNVPMRLVMNGSSSFPALLADVFDARTLSLMECAFEEDPAMGTAFQVTDESRGAADFGRRYVTDEERAVAVAENIIANDGLFVVRPVSAEEYDDEGDDDAWGDDEADDFGDEEDDLWEDDDEGDDL